MSDVIGLWPDDKHLGNVCFTGTTRYVTSILPSSTLPPLLFMYFIRLSAFSRSNSAASWK